MTLNNPPTALLAKALASLSYAQVFGFPLSAAELRLRFWGKRVSLELAVTALEQLQHLGLVIERAAQWALVTQPESFQHRAQRELISEQKIQTAQTQVVPLVKKIPWIKGVFITGSVAATNALPQDDIDFMIITASGRLWLSRAALFVLTWRRGVRRPWQATHSGDSVQNTWCFNLWLTTSTLTLPGPKQSVYSAYEVLQAKMIWGDSDLPARWLDANQWVGRFLPSWWDASRGTAAPVGQGLTAGWLWLLFPMVWIGDRVLDVLNVMAFVMQKLYMWPHQTHELVALEYAYFHPRDTGLQIADRWFLRLHQLFGKPTRVLVTGVFDVLHHEHVTFLEKARELGDELVVGLESDARVTQLKGPERPVNSQAQRVAAIEALGLANSVFVLPEGFSTPDDHLALLKAWRPAVLAVSSHTSHLEVKQALMSQVGGRVMVVHQHNPEISSTKLIRKGVTSPVMTG